MVNQFLDFNVERIDAVLYVLSIFYITVAVLFVPKALYNTGKTINDEKLLNCTAL